MISYDLINLEVHPSLASLRQPWHVGPFRIVFEQDYAQKYFALRSGGAHQSLVTAKAHVDDPGAAMLAAPPLLGGSPEPAVWDLLQILSYLTGRRVMLPEHVGRYPLGRSTYELTDSEETLSAARTAWDHRVAFGPAGRLPTLWLYLQAMTTAEAEVRGATACVALENTVRDVEDGAEPHAPEALRDAIMVLINEFGGLSSVERDRFRSGAQHWGRPGLGALIRGFVEHYALATLSDGSLAKKRANHVAEVRNGLLHTGSVREPSWIRSDEDDKQAAFQRGAAVFYVAQFIPALVQIHLDHLFGIEEYRGPRRTFDNVGEYLNMGTWAGDNVEKGSGLPSHSI